MFGELLSVALQEVTFGNVSFRSWSSIALVIHPLLQVSVEPHWVLVQILVESALSVVGGGGGGVSVLFAFFFFSFFLKAKTISGFPLSMKKSQKKWRSLRCDQAVLMVHRCSSGRGLPMVLGDPASRAVLGGSPASCGLMAVLQTSRETGGCQE